MCTVAGLFLVVFAALTQVFVTDGVSFGNISILASPFPISIPIVLMKITHLGALASILPMFIAMISTGIILGLVRKVIGHQDPNWSESVSRKFPKWLVYLWCVCTISLIVFLNIFQWYVNGWLPYGWDTPQLLWQPSLFSSFHGLFPPNPYRYGLVDTPPAYLFLLNMLYHLLSNKIAVFESVQIALIVLISSSIFFLTKSVSNDNITSAISVALFSTELGFYLLEWGSFQNLFALVLLNFAILSSQRNGRLYYLSPFLYAGAIFSEDSGIILTAGILFFCLGWNFSSLSRWIRSKFHWQALDSKILRTLASLVIGILITIPYEVAVLEERGSAAIGGTASIIGNSFNLSLGDFVWGTGGVILLGISGWVLTLKSPASKHPATQILFGYLAVCGVLSLPYFFVLQFRFLWMLTIPLAIFGSLLIGHFHIKFGTFWRIFIIAGLILSQLVFGMGFVSATIHNQCCTQSAGFPGTYVSTRDLNAFNEVKLYVSDCNCSSQKLIIVTPSQYNNWLIYYARTQVLPQDENIYDNLSVAQWIMKLKASNYHVLLFASSAYTAFLGAGPSLKGCLVYTNGWDYLYDMSNNSCSKN